MKHQLLSTLRFFDNFYYRFVGPIRVLFVVRNRIGISCLLPIIKEAKKHENIFIAITVEYQGCYEWPSDGDEADLKQKFYVDPGVSQYLKWHYVFNTDISLLWFRRDCTKVLISHGVGFGNLDKVSQANQRPYLDRLLSDGGHALYFLNSFSKFKYIESNFSLDPSKAFFVSGFPRMDKLFNSPKLNDKSFLREYKLCPNKISIVIASHWNSKSLLLSLRTDFIKEILMIFRDVNLIVTGHENLWRDLNKESLAEELTLLSEEVDNLVFITKPRDTLALLRTADVFIGDNSSIFIEFCLLDKPILLFDNPSFTFESEKVGMLYRKAANRFANTEELSIALKDVLSKKDNKNNERKRVVDFFLDRQGVSSEYLISAIKTMGKISGPTCKKWKDVQQLSQHEFLNYDEEGNGYERQD